MNERKKYRSWNGYSVAFVLMTIIALLNVSCTDRTIYEPDSGSARPQPESHCRNKPDTSCSGTLPVLHINTENNDSIKSKEEYIQAVWWIDALGLDGYESIGSERAPYSMQIKGHGNITWTQPEKKPYRIKLDEKHQMLGMPSSRHWVLLANANSWMGKMNDALPFEIGRRMGMSWNPRIEPVEVVLNDEYIGLYFLTEKIRVAKERVNIKEQADLETNPYKVTGGWLLEIDNYIEPDNITFTEGNGKPFWVTPHSPELLSKEQRDYITSFLVKADSAIYLEDKNNRLWEQFIDIDALAIYYIVQEAVDNPEAFSGSCYLYKQQGPNSKLIFGPLWDCGSSFHRWSSTYEFNNFIYENMPDYCRSRWIGEIVKFPHFQERVRHYWRIFYEEVYPTMDAYMDYFAAKIESACEADFVRWPQYSSNNNTLRLNRFARPSFHKKVAWLNSIWGNSQLVLKK